ncbi:MAG: D-alanine-D-alanine ligase [Candidatus Improbicoccus devescovinae]|nr:MAG: D-alanine-D-alanine ligase [Candidatus Improbicoccus devescovinae]
MNLVLICGGPSPERNISLNSARSVYDALYVSKNMSKIYKNINIKIIFISKNYEKYIINEEFLYSNTASDFDFKLKHESQALNDQEFELILKNSDLAFPVMHGIFGEDGQIQSFFDKINVNYVGAPPSACFNMYNKKMADSVLKANGFFRVLKLFVAASDEFNSKIIKFFADNNLEEAIVKPVQGGSSFGVHHAKNAREAIEFCEKLIKSGEPDVLIEQKCEGAEFTVIILQSLLTQEPVACIPTEIEVKDNDNIIFDTRRKYLATNETHYHFPPRFSYEIISEIRQKSEQLFKIFGARDFLRVDGWVILNKKTQKYDLYFSDFNPISGMEQNSFIFQQCSKIGFTHEEIIKYIINLAYSRNKKNINKKIVDFSKNHSNNKQKVNILFGGVTSERQVSLLSGANVWLKLLKSDFCHPEPYLLYSNSKNNKNFLVQNLNYDMVLYHTVEEILFQSKHKLDSNFKKLINNIRSLLGLKKIAIQDQSDPISLQDFFENSKYENSYVFLALHGGFGENGEIQKLLENHKLKFNGSGSVASELCMNKFKTGEIVNSLGLENFRSADKILFNINEKLDVNDFFLKNKNKKIVIKPNSDGCSTGVVVINNKKELEKYLNFVKSGQNNIPMNSFEFQNIDINLDCNIKEYILEEFIETKIGEFVELTIGVLESHGIYHAMNPSFTATSAGAILNVEEKFQGGVGINITPPTLDIININLRENIKFCVEKLCEKINIKSYCRVDLFANNATNEIIIIEINTLPALTPATVIFQQASKELVPMNPFEFIENLIKI